IPTSLTLALEVVGSTLYWDGSPQPPPTPGGLWQHRLRWGQSAQIVLGGGEALTWGAFAFVDQSGQVLEPMISQLDSRGMLVWNVQVPSGLVGTVRLIGGALDSQAGILVSAIVPVDITP